MPLDDAVERVIKAKTLLGCLAIIDSTTWKTSEEVFKIWQRGAPVERVNTANLAVYRLIDGEAVFNLLGREGNPFCDERFQKEAYDCIGRMRYFFPSETMKEYILGAISADATVHYSGLDLSSPIPEWPEHLKKSGPDYEFVTVNRKNKPEEKKLFEAVYGTKNPGKGKKVMLLRKDIVQKMLDADKDRLIVRGCYFSDDQDFVAIDRPIAYDSSSYEYAVYGKMRENL